MILWIIAHQAPLAMEFSSKDTGVDSHFFLQGIFLTQGLNSGLLHCRQIPYHVGIGCQKRNCMVIAVGLAQINFVQLILFVIHL